MRSKSRKRALFAVIPLALALCAMVFWLFGAVPALVHVEVGQAVPEASALVRFGLGFDAHYIDPKPDNIDINIIRDNEVILRALWLDRRVTLRYADTIPPRAVVKDLVENYVGGLLAPMEFFEEIIDATAVTLRYVTPPDMQLADVIQAVEIELTDEGGNTVRVTGQCILELDTEPPVIHGVTDISVGKNGAVAYRRGVSVTHPSGRATLEVDSSRVNTNVPGVYEVVYIATSPSGLTSRAETRVTVAAATEEEVQARVRPVLEEIIAPGMDDEAKARAIHSWIKGHISYNDTGEKKSVIDGAYSAMALRRGDCYTFYAIAKFMLDQVGIESVDLVRTAGPFTRHYWLALNFGDGWYHYDATPVKTPQLHPKGGFMMDDKEAKAYGVAIRRPEYYEFDASKLPYGLRIVGQPEETGKEVNTP